MASRLSDWIPQGFELCPLTDADWENLLRPFTRTRRPKQILTALRQAGNTPLPVNFEKDEGTIKSINSRFRYLPLPYKLVNSWTGGSPRATREYFTQIYKANG